MDIKIVGRYEGKTIQSYTLRNKNGMEVEILNLGGIIKNINYKGKNRVLGFENYRDYIEDKNYFGAIVGPLAGRISSGRFSIDGEDYMLTKNDGENSLHGGYESLSKKIWTLYTTVYNGLYESFTLKYKAKDGEGGYPGNRTFFVTYTLNNDNEFIIEYKIRTDKETYASLANQIYFNFNDDLEKEIINHNLLVCADSYIRVDDNRIPYSKEEVSGTVFDFRNQKMIGDSLDLNNMDLKRVGGYNHPFILNSGVDKKISLNYKDIEMDIETTEPVVVVYTANDLSSRKGICLETQSYPDGMNKDFLGMDTIKPEEEQYSRTIYNFK